ncbi:MAG: hypothetical protein J7518_14035 [Nocardioidaceae bacterium]|nr:hypothetical protein [Nocardioidaceae bacterium]
MLLIALVLLPLLVLVGVALLDEAGRVLLPDVDRSGEPEVTAAEAA